MLYQVYLITNNINGKRYVGQTSQDRGYLNRFEEHLKVSKTKKQKTLLHCAIKCYGDENFSVKLLMHDIEESKIDFYESVCIKRFNTYYVGGYGYNMTYGGQGVHGYVYTEEVKQKMRVAIKAMWTELKSEPVRVENLFNARSKALKGKQFSEEHCRKLSAIAKQRFGEKNPFYGKKHTEETKDKIADANSKKVCMCDISSSKVIKVFDSLADATTYLVAESVTLNKSASSRICKICNGDGKTAYGYVWRYL